MKLTTTLILSLYSLASAGTVPSLTSDNYESMIAFKNVFIKFFRPECKLCQSIKEDWETLADEWEDSEIGLVAEVDCTLMEAYKLCKDYKIEKFPTIKYGDPSKGELKDYRDSRKIEVTSPFAKEKLVPICSPINLDLCENHERRIIEKSMEMDDEEISRAVKEGERKIYIAQDKYHFGKMELDNIYKDIKAKRNKIRTAEAMTNLKLMKIVKKFNDGM